MSAPAREPAKNFQPRPLKPRPLKPRRLAFAILALLLIGWLAYLVFLYFKGVRPAP